LAAAISAIAVFGLGIGLTAPLLSLKLETRGVDASLIGFNAAVTFVGVIIGASLVPMWVRRFGLRPFMLGCLALDAAFFLLLKVFDDVYAWFPLRLGTGIIGSSLFTASEAWISSIAGDANRGRIIGIYAAVLSAGFGIGPLLLPFTGIEGWTPFIANAVISMIAMLPLLKAGSLAPRFERANGFGPFGFLRKAPLIALAVMIFGLYESAMLALLPVWGVRVGLTTELSAAMLSAIYFGGIAFQVPVGWLSDRVPRFAVLRLCAISAVVGCVTLPLLRGEPPALLAALFIWGGITVGVYAVALSVAGDRFRGADLVAANAALVMLYGIGSLAGPAVAGIAMDLWNPHGLLAVMAVIFGGFLAGTIFSRSV
jgi:MFS family permease